MIRSPVVTVPEISREFATNRERVRGWLEALHIPTERIGTADVITRRDFERLKASMKSAAARPPLPRFRSS